MFDVGDAGGRFDQALKTDRPVSRIGQRDVGVHQRLTGRLRDDDRGGLDGRTPEGGELRQCPLGVQSVDPDRDPPGHKAAALQGLDRRGQRLGLALRDNRILKVDDDLINLDIAGLGQHPLGTAGNNQGDHRGALI
jgi:hypothetical protein